MNDHSVDECKNRNKDSEKDEINTTMTSPPRRRKNNSLEPKDLDEIDVERMLTELLRFPDRNLFEKQNPIDDENDVDENGNAPKEKEQKEREREREQQPADDMSRTTENNIEKQKSNDGFYDDDDNQGHFLKRLLHFPFGSGNNNDTQPQLGKKRTITSDETTSTTSSSTPEKDRDGASANSSVNTKQHNAAGNLLPTPPQIIRQAGATVQLPLVGMSFDDDEAFFDSFAQLHQPRQPQHDQPHQFRTCTYPIPTYCHCCNGLLVGLWRQGMQCQTCHMNIHHGQGKGDHDDCRAEALLTSCPGTTTLPNNDHPTPSSSRNAPSNVPKNPTRQFDPLEQLQRIRQMFLSHPHLFEEIAEQLDKDFMTNIKQVIIKEGTDNERTQKIRRFRERTVQPTLKVFNDIESKGWTCSLLWLLYYHFLLIAVLAPLIAALFVVILLPTRHGVTQHGVLLHTSTVLLLLYVGLLWTLAMVIRYATILFQRKEIIVDTFLRQTFTIQAHEDFGISVSDAASKARLWSDRVVVTTTLMCLATAVVWYHFEHAFSSHLVVGLGGIGINSEQPLSINPLATALALTLNEVTDGDSDR